MMRTFLLCRLFTTDWLKPEIVTGQYNSRTEFQTLYFLVGVTSEARIEKIAKNIELLTLKEI